MGVIRKESNLSFSVGVRIRQLLTGLGLLVFLAYLSLQTFGSVYRHWNSLRLAPSCALKEGVSIYGLPGEGVLLSGVNAPLQPLVYLPAFWLASLPSEAVRISAGIALFFFYLPWFLALFLFAKKIKTREKWAWLVVALILSFFSFRSHALSLSASLVHADAPAFGFAAIGLAILLKAGERPGLSSLFLSALFLFLGGSSKITVLPLLLLPPFWFLLMGSFREILRYFFALAVVSLFFLGIFEKVHGLRELYFTQVESTFKHPWLVNLNAGEYVGFATTKFSQLKVLLSAFDEILGEYYPYMVLVGAYFLYQVTGWQVTGRRMKSYSNFVKENTWLLFLMASLFLLPSSLMGRVKLGGNLNTQSPFVYFLFLTTGAVLLHSLRLDGIRKTERLAGPVIISFFVVGLGMAGFDSYKVLWPLKEKGNPLDEAFYYIQKHPGSYFPDYALSHCMAEKKVFHSYPALAELSATPFAPTREQVLAHVPNPVNELVFKVPYRQPIMSSYFPQFAEDSVPDPVLPGWYFFRPAREKTQGSVSSRSKPPSKVD
jgi:hypothetical protein